MLFNAPDTNTQTQGTHGLAIGNWQFASLVREILKSHPSIPRPSHEVWRPGG
jgi:hypothetical protein